MDFNKIIARAKAILLTPKTEWPVIAGEPATVADLYKGYIVILAAIPAVFGFLHTSIIGMNVMFAGRVRIGMGAGLTSAIVQYLLTLIGVFVLAIIVEALAPTFGGQKDRVQALKTVGYAYTATWVASVGHIIPGIGLLIAIAGAVYGIYLLYLSMPHTMKSPQEKSAGYTVATVVAAIVLYVVIGSLVAGIAGTAGYLGGAMNYGSSSDVEFDKDSPMGKLEQWSKNMEEAGKKMDAAEQSGDKQAQGEALKQMMGAALGGGEVEALAPELLKPFVPSRLAGMARSSFAAERNTTMGIQISRAAATYSNDQGRSLDLEITDTGTAKGLLAFAGWSGMQGEHEDDQGYEKTYHDDDRLVHEAWDNDSSSGEYAVVLGDRFTVKVAGSAGSMNELKSAVGELNLRGLEALKDEGTEK